MATQTDLDAARAALHDHHDGKAGSHGAKRRPAG